MNREIANLVFADPPYNVPAGREGGQCVGRRQRPGAQPSTYATLDGKQMNVPADGLITVRAEDAGPLIAVGWMAVE
jgi:hypothetical protein